MRTVLVLTVLTALTARPSAPRADEERALSLGLSFATLGVERFEDQGLLVGLDYEHGLSETLSLRLGGGAGWYPKGDGSQSGHGLVGIRYAFDVIRYVPYVNLGAGALVLFGNERETALKPLLEVGVGVDRLLGRDWSYGIHVRFASFLADVGFFTAGLRATYRWGYF